MTWFGEYNYRKKVNITGQYGAGINYQVKFTIGKESGGDFHLENHNVSYPNDIRFTNKDGETELSYWIEDNTTNPITVWINVDDNLDDPTSIYCYYGNISDCSSNSSGINTFIVYDDFNETAIGTLSGSAILSGGALRVQYQYDWTYYWGAISYNGSNINIPALEGFRMKYRYIRTTGSSKLEGNVYPFAWDDSVPTAYNNALNGYHWRSYEFRDGGYQNAQAGLYFDGSQIKEANFLSGCETWKTGEFSYDAITNRFQGWEGGTRRLNFTDINRTNLGYLIGFGARRGGGTYPCTTYLDDMIITKYVYPEPSFYSAEAEKSIPGITSRIYINTKLYYP